MTHPWLSRKAQIGVGLIEVLVAVLVLSIGFVGIAAMQARSLSTNNSALARSMATVASYSILDAMRADIAGAEAGNYNGTVKANACPDAGSALDTEQLSAWCNQLGSTLGASASTSGNVDCSAVTNSTALCTVTIQFDDSRAGEGGGSAQQVVTRAML
jgi:type IV pilus assembly protein PilV